MLNLTLDADSLNKSQLALLASRDPFVLFAGGVGAGKTLGLVLKLLQLKAENKGLPGLLIAPTYGSLWSVTLRSLFSFLATQMPRRALPKVRDRQYECYLDFGDGGPVFLRSATRPDLIDGLNVAWVCGDEARYWPARTYEVAIARMRTPGPLNQVALSSTPEMNWLAEEFDRNKAGRRLIRAPTAENAHNLREGFIADIRASYSPRLQRAMLDGEFTILEGSVYEEFDPAPRSSNWIIDYDAKSHSNRPRKTYLAVDPGFRRSAWLWAHQTGPADWVVFDEMAPDNTSDMACVEMVNARGWPIDEIWTDPAADNTQSLSGIDTIRALNAIKTRQRGGIRTIVDPWRSIESGVDKVRVMLGGNGMPIRIKFARDMVMRSIGKPRSIVRDLASYRYPEIKDGRAVTNLPLKDGLTDHSCLAGNETICIDGYGWQRIDSVNGLTNGMVLTHQGYAHASIIKQTAKEKECFEVFFDGFSHTATGDHRFVVSRACRCGRTMSGFSWETVLSLRKIFSEIDEGRDARHAGKKIFAQGGLVQCEWCNKEKPPHTPHRRKQIKQQFMEFEGNEQNTTFFGEFKKQEPYGIYMLGVRQEFLEQRKLGEILSHKLSLGMAPNDFGFEIHKIKKISNAGKIPVYCAHVPTTRSFVLESGIVSHNCDALRYLAMGLFLTTPELREKDPAMRGRENKPGWRSAA